VPFSCGVGGSRQRMFNLVNTYYKDLCTPKISIEPKDPSSPDPSGVAPGIPDVPVKDLTKEEYELLQRHEMCKVGWLQLPLQFVTHVVTC
jgi:hypothetical protein